HGGGQDRRDQGSRVPPSGPEVAQDEPADSGRRRHGGLRTLRPVRRRGNAFTGVPLLPPPPRLSGGPLLRLELLQGRPGQGGAPNRGALLSRGVGPRAAGRGAEQGVPFAPADTAGRLRPAPGSGECIAPSSPDPLPRTAFGISNASTD